MVGGGSVCVLVVGSDASDSFSSAEEEGMCPSLGISSSSSSSSSSPSEAEA